MASDDRRIELEFPSLRAHVYYATPRVALRSALEVAASLPQLGRITYAGISGDADSNERSLLIRFVDSSGNRSHAIAFDALALGPAHTRLVVRCLSRESEDYACEAAILAIRSGMDKRLT